MALRDWLAQGRAIVHLKDISYSLKRIANALEERNLSEGGRTGLSLRTLYEDPRSPEEADLLNMTDYDFYQLELLEDQKRKHQGEASDLTDEEVEGVLPR